MCGIHLIIDKKKKLDPLSSHPIESMMRSATHRGPDAQGFLQQEYDTQNIWIAGNRLRIVDPAPVSDQPMVSPCGRYVLVYNGEIYNYPELRNQLLEEGVRFTSHSDTEVLLRLLMKKGKEALPMLNGMFAFAFYDWQKETLLAARDSFGMKPLYYHDDEQYLLLSSEAKSILASGLVRKELNERQVTHYLRFKYAQPGHTFFRTIFSLLPGSLLHHTSPRGTKITSFYPIAAREPLLPRQFRDEPAVLKETETLLTDAVLKHVTTEVPCGLFLSGGIDSTLLLAIIHQQGAHPVPTFSIVNEQKDQNFGTRDYYYAAKAAEMFGNYHYELELQPGLVEGAWIDFMDKTDQPVADSASLMTYLLSREARKVASVVLSGGGADELFGGYHRHKAYHWYLKHHALLQKAGTMLTFSKYLPTGMAHPWRKHFRLLKKLGQSLSSDPAETYRNFRSLQTPLPLGTTLAKMSESQLPIREPVDDGFVEKHLFYALAHDLHHYLPFDVLTVSDNMSMAQSLEMRMPYLDQEVASFARHLPATYRLQHGPKWILKQILESYGGKAFTRRKKEGFGLPAGAWLRREEYRFLLPPLEDPEAILFQFVPYKKVQHMLQSQRAQKTDYSQELWALLMLSAWLGHHIG